MSPVVTVETLAVGPEAGDRVHAARPIGHGRRLADARVASRVATSKVASRTSSSTCCSRAPPADRRRPSRRTIDSIGGQLDAFTAKEFASYYIKVLDDHLPLAIDLLTIW